MNKGGKEIRVVKKIMLWKLITVGQKNIKMKMRVRNGVRLEMTFGLKNKFGVEKKFAF